MLKLFALLWLWVISFFCGIASAIYGYGLEIASWHALIGFYLAQWFIMLLMVLIRDGK